MAHAIQMQILLLLLVASYMEKHIFFIIQKELTDNKAASFPQPNLLLNRPPVVQDGSRFCANKRGSKGNGCDVVSVGISTQSRAFSIHNRA